MYPAQYTIVFMKTKLINVSLRDEDIKVLKEVQERLFSTHGTLSRAAIIRMALRRVAIEQHVDNNAEKL